VGEHSTSDKEEILVVLKGMPTVIVEGVATQLATGSLFYIPPNQKHNVINREIFNCAYAYICADLSDLVAQKALSREALEAAWPQVQEANRKLR